MRVIPDSLDSHPLQRSLMRTVDVAARVGLSRSQIYALAAAGKFPRPVKYASNLSVWPSDEIQQWIDARIGERDAALAAARARGVDHV